MYAITFILISTIMLRVLYINALVDDWNHYLAIYIASRRDRDGCNVIKYMERKKLKPWKYYHRIDVWTIKKVINDPFLLTDVHNYIQMSYKP
jgi:hypothetical protein